MKLVILGGGESGTGAAILGKQKGWEVFLSDKSSLKEVYKKELDAKEANIPKAKSSLPIVSSKALGFLIRCLSYSKPRQKVLRLSPR